MTIVFRLDAHGALGLGHLMRCLVLAGELRARGAVCTFVCRAAGPWLARRVEGAGHVFREIGVADGTPAESADAAATAAVVRELAGVGRRVTLLVVDHYALGAAWESVVGPLARRVWVIDDLADRVHACDLLLDPGPGRRAEDYAGLVPDACEVMAGVRFAPVGAAIVACRAASLHRRARAGFAIRRVLVTMGGADADNDSTTLLERLGTTLPVGIAIDVVLGASCPWVDEVRRLARASARSVRVHVDTRDMGALMAASDMAIGASGGTALERCVLGLPAIALVTADNQRRGAEALHARGAARLAGSREAVFPMLADWLDPTHGAARLARGSAAAAAVCDGEGRHRVLARVLDGVSA